MTQTSALIGAKPGLKEWSQQVWLNMLYLWMTFFLGLCYFTLLIVGIAVGFGTLIVWIGVPILFATLSLGWYLGGFERWLAIKLLRIHIAPMSTGVNAPDSLWQRFQTRLSNPMTWKVLCFLLLKLPVGACCFGFAVALPLVSLSLALVGLLVGLFTAPFYALLVALLDTQRPRQRFLQYLRLSLAGFGLNRLAFALLNGLAWLQGLLAQGLLGMSDSALRLEAARTSERQARQEAEQAELRRRELVVNVSHELRAPVASISGHLESLLLSTADGTQLPEAGQLYAYLSIAYQEARRLGTLVDDLLELARMEAHELRLVVGEVRAQEVIEEVYTTLMPLARRERDVTLVRGTQPHLPPVCADRQRLIQVLTNLVRNAITSTPAGGIVSLSLEQADAEHLALIVEDSGMGIPPDELEKIFERFYRTDLSRSRKTGGFGLGLAIVHELVTAMGGSISVQSVPGQGSRFCVLLRTS